MTPQNRRLAHTLFRMAGLSAVSLGWTGCNALERNLVSTGRHGETDTICIVQVEPKSANACPKPSDVEKGLLATGAIDGYDVIEDSLPMRGDTTCCYRRGRREGRPFRDGRVALSAGSIPRSDWGDATLLPNVSSLTDDERHALGRHWRGAALSEHASIASFMCFALDLLSLGAPPDLVLRSQQAALDEVQHARMCFALASAYAGVSVGPGGLPMPSTANRGAAEIVANAVASACVSETLAAFVVGERLATASDPAVRQVLASIARDEADHAVFAWEFLQWALARKDPAIASAAAEAFSTSSVEGLAVAHDPLDSKAYRDHGVLSTMDETQFAARILHSVIAPSACAMLAA